MTYKVAQIIDARNALGLNYSVFGNHKFDIKTLDLMKRIDESKFAWLGTNVIDKNTGKIFDDLPPYEIREIGSVNKSLIF